MYKLPTLITISTLALTGCLEQDSSENTTQNPPLQESSIVNPFDPVTNPPNELPNDPPISQPPIQQPPVTQPPISQPPITQPPIAEPPISQPPVSGNLDTGTILNGATEFSIDSLWICEETNASGSDDVTVLGFFGNGNGILGDDEDLFPISWAVSGPYVEIYEGGEYLAQFDNISANAAAGTLNMTYTASNGESGSLRCMLSKGDSSGNGSGSQPPVIISTPPGGGTSVPTQQESLVNSHAGDDLQNAWVCELADGSPAVMFFLAQGEGGIISSTYPDGIVMQWSITEQGVTMSLADGNTVSLSQPLFSGDDYFQVNNVNYQGTDIPGMACELTDL